MKKAYYIKQFGSSFGSFELEINIGINRELTNVDKVNISEYAELLINKIHEETIKNNPKSIEEAKNEKEDLINLFGSDKIFVEEIPNEYCNRYCCKHLPWFLVTTKAGKIKIGWRKRVINIDWSESVVVSKAEDIFPNEDVTKGDKYIHAWGLEKAKEYIDKILNSK